MNRHPLAVRAAQLLANAFAIIAIWLPYLIVVGTWRAARWAVTTGVPHGLFSLGLGVLLLFLGVYLAAKYALAHGPDLLSALSGDAQRLASLAWSRVGQPARLMLGGAVAVVALAAVVFTVCSAI